jgi:hypothetical protein
MRVEYAKPRYRILGLEVRPRITGFAVLEEPARLLDCGTRKHRVGNHQLASVTARKTNALLDLYFPSVVVARARSVRFRKARRRIAAIVRIVRRETRKHPVRFHIIDATAVRRFFALRGCASKHDVAALLARWFPELSWKLPPTRKTWKSEDHRMVVFDATATALAFLNRSPPEEG